MQLRSALLLVASVATTVGEASGQSGRELVARLGCAAATATSLPRARRAAPALALSAARTHPGYLEAFLAAPRKMHADTRMPDVLAGRSNAERVDAAASLAAYVRSLAPAEDGFDVASDWKRGERLYHQVGCVHCHGPRAADAVTGQRGPDAGGRTRAGPRGCQVHGSRPRRVPARPPGPPAGGTDARDAPLARRRRRHRRVPRSGRRGGPDPLAPAERLDAGAGRGGSRALRGAALRELSRFGRWRDAAGSGRPVPVGRRRLRR